MLIAMAVHDTEDNERNELTRRTLNSLHETVDWNRHSLIVSDNGSCRATQRLYQYYEDIIDKLILNGENIGTANAINRAWYYRTGHQHAVKMDNDVVIHQSGWADLMEEVFARDPVIGICGLKRKDCEETPWNKAPWYRSEIRMLPHERGQRWLIVERAHHVMGTCQAYSSKLLEKLGYLVQPRLYGFDDALASVRSSEAGFHNVFLHGIEIDHIDPGGSDYTEWKKKHSGEDMRQYHKMRDVYQSGGDVFYNGGKRLLEYAKCLS